MADRAESSGARLLRELTEQMGGNLLTEVFYGLVGYSLFKAARSSWSRAKRGGQLKFPMVAASILCWSLFAGMIALTIYISSRKITMFRDVVDPVMEWVPAQGQRLVALLSAAIFTPWQALIASTAVLAFLILWNRGAWLDRRYGRDVTEPVPSPPAAEEAPRTVEPGVKVAEVGSGSPPSPEQAVPHAPAWYTSRSRTPDPVRENRRGLKRMPISWNEIRHNAFAFSKEWADETSEDQEAKTFWDDFFRVFGIKRRTVASFEEPVRKLSGNWGYIDLFWPGTLLVEHKSRGRSLDKANSQAMEYIRGLKDAGRDDEIPRYIVLSDFARFALHDLEEDTTFPFELADLNKNIQLFAFIPGYKQAKLEAEDPVNIKAVVLLGDLYDALKDGGYAGHDLERFLVRILFCLFAEDTGIFERNAFRVCPICTFRPPFGSGIRHSPPRVPAC